MAWVAAAGPPPKWLYDQVGSDLFDEITRLPEYYPTECERAILREHADDIVEACDATTFVELGSGTSDKTRTLLDAFTSTGRLERFVPVDVSEQTLRDAATMLSERYPSLRVRLSSATSRCTWATSRAVTGASSPSSVARSATSTSRSGPPSSVPSTTASSRATGSCSAPTSSRAPTG